jgi:predicted CopG family antitoxin
MCVSKQEVDMKKRRNFTLSDEALKKLSEMAKKEGRSQSSMIEQLILRESAKCQN